MAESKDKKQNWFAKHKVITAVLIIFGIIVIAGIAGGSSSSENTVTDTNTDNQVNNQQVSQPAETNKQKEWVKVAEISGKTDKMSETFALTGGKVRVSYEVTGGDMCMTIIYLEKDGTDLMAQGGFPIVTVSESMSDSSLVNKAAGDYQIQVKNSVCEYTVMVEEER